MEEQCGWDAPVKAKSRVRSKPKRTFVDPSLPASLLSMTPERLLRETQVFGTLFEELCLRDVRVYCSAHGEHLQGRRRTEEQERTFNEQLEHERAHAEGSAKLEEVRRERDMMRQRNSRLCRKYGLKGRRERKG